MELLQTEARQVQLRLMYVFFNYVSLGQWQLARMSLHRLSEELEGGALLLDGDNYLDLPSLLRAIILHPHIVWRYSPSIPSPHHLSWLCLSESKAILTEEERKLPANIDDLVEFHILLYTVQNELQIESDCKECVIDYYHSHLLHLNNPSTPISEVEPLTEEFLSYLYNILSSNRAIGDCIIQLLIIQDMSAYTDNNIRLFEVYVRCVDDAVGTLKNVSVDERQPIVDKIYGILGVFDPPSLYQSKLKIGSLFIKLLQAEPFGLRRELTYNCCLGRSTTTLVRILTEVEALQFESQYKEGSFISKNSQLFEERKLKWSNIFLHAFYNKTHILQEILDRGLELVRENDFDSLSELMRDPEWRPMSSLLLLLAWDHCKSMQSAKKLLDTLYHPQDQSSQPALFAAIQKLYYQVNLADWCIDKVRPILSVSSGSSISSGSFQQEGDIFTRLESQSILYMLHQSNSLSSSDPKEIMELLKMSPSIGDIPGAEATSIPKTSSQARDIAVYKSFCAIRLTMDAILCSAQLSSLLKEEGARGQLLEILSCSKGLEKRFPSGEVFIPQQDSASLLDKPFLSEDSTYNDRSSLNADQVTLILAIDAYINKILEDVKNYLQSVHPLNYRLEILENIYSLLFLKYEDLAVDSSDLDDKKNQNYTRCDLKEYLNLSISRNLGYKQNISATSNGDIESNLERSSTLTSSTSSLAREKRVDPAATGFLLSRPMMEKMLQLLKEAIYDIQSSRYALRRDSTPDQSPEQEQSVYSSIASDSLHSRHTQLEKCINEANWRYKLVTTTETMPSSLDESGVPLSEEQTLCLKWEMGLSFESETQSSSDLDFSNEEDEIDAGDRRHSSITIGTGHLYTKPDVVFLSDREQKPKTSSPKLKLGDSGDEGDTEDKEIIAKPKIKSSVAVRKHKRNCDKYANNSSNQNIVRKMLSSPENLLQMCLKLGNFVSAYEVIKIFKLEGHIGAQIVHFAEKIESIGNEMTAVSKQDEESSFDPIEIMSKEIVTSEDFDRITLPLTKNSAVMDDLVNILVSTNLSKIMLSGDERLLLRSRESAILKQLVNYVPSLIILDLLCTYDISYETSRELLKNATQKLTSQFKIGSIPAPKLSRTSSAGALKPLATKAFDNNFIFDNYSLSQPLQFLQTINDIIKTSGDLILPLQLVRNGRLLKTLTPHFLLTKFTDSFRPTHFVSMKKLREFQYRAVERLFKAVLSTIAIEEQGHVNEMTLDNVTSSLNDLFKAFSTNREGVLLPSTATALTDTLTPDPLDKLVLELPGTSTLIPDQTGSSLSIGDELDHLSSEFPQMNSLKYTYSYFDWFFQHLETIRSFLIKHNLEENVTALSSMVLLKESPSKIVARLIFERQLRPDILEELAKLIKLDVVQIMIRFTCPPLNSCSRLFDAHALLERDTPTLNHVAECGAIADQTVDTLLSHSEQIISLALDVLNARIQVNDEFLGFEYLSRCSEETMFAQLEDRLQILNGLDLILLVTDEEKMIFYTNILNALNIHAAIRQSVLMRKRGEDLSIFGVATMFSFFMQSCYSIGQLSLINLLDLQFKILKVHSLDDSFVASKGLRTLTYTSNKRDRFREFCLKQSDPRLVFVIGSCILGNFNPKVLNRNNLKETLTESAQSFCSTNIEFRPQIVKETKTVIVPEFLTWYASHFNTKRDLTYEQKRDLIVLNLQDFLPKSFQNTHCRTNIEAIAHIWRFGFFTVTDNVNLLEVSTTMHLSPIIESLNAKTSESTQKYSLNEATLHYISTRNEILGKLATFVCLPNQPVGASKRISLSEDEKQLSIRSQSSLGEKRSSIVSLSRMFTRTTHSQGSEYEDEAGFEKHVDRILNIFLDIPVLKAYFEDLFNTLNFARRITTFIRSEADESNAHISLQRIEMNPPVSFEQSADGSAKPISFNIHELFLGDKSNDSSIRTCILCLDHLIAKRRWINAFDIVNSESFLPFKDSAWYLQLRDLILIGCANYIRRQREKNEEMATTRASATSEEAFKFLMQLNNFEMLGEIVLDIIYEWNDTQLCLNILQHAHSNLNETTSLKNRVGIQLEKLKIYSEILSTLVKSDQNPLSNEESVRSGGYPEWRHWRVIKRQTASMPLVIVRHLSRKGEFELAKRWAKTHRVPDPIHLHIEKENILFLFTKPEPDFATAHLILEEFTPKDLSAKLCLSLLDSLTYPRQILFVVQFALQHLTPFLSGEELENLRKQQLGSQALLCIDSESVLQYTKLTDDVALLIEQLIMNLKIQWASRVVERVTKDIKSTTAHLPRSPGKTYISQLTPSIDDMAFKYAELAIDLRIGTDQPISDVCSPSAPSPNSGVPFQFEPIPKHTPDTTDSEESLHVQSRPIPIGKSSVLPHTPKHIEPSSAPGNYMLGARRPSREFTKTVQESILEVGQVLVQTHAVQDIKISKKAEWTPDQKVEKCQICGHVYFGIINRKHHCRKCGSVVCRDCSSHKYYVDGYQGLVRVCDSCHKSHYSKPSVETAEVGLKMKTGRRSSLGSSLIEKENSDSLFKPRQSYFWELIKNNREKNNKLRSEFYFEQAPNPDLCISIALMHSDSDKVAEFLLYLAVKLSERLRDVFDSPEVDCLYVVDMVKKLLNKSKMLSSMAESVEGVNKCDLYLDRIGLIQSFISIQDSEIQIPSLIQLSESDDSRYIRDSLIRYSYWQLALDISTKCQLDTSSVWSSWGLSCLKDGHYDAAREKLKHCLQLVGVASQQQASQQNQKLVSQIVEQIEGSLLSLWHSDDILNSLKKENTRSLEAMIEAENRPANNTHMSMLQFEEVLFYLKSFGTHKQMLEFLVKYRLVKRACNYVQSQNCSSEIFREGLLIPCMKLCLWEDLKKEIASNDPSLRHWSYLFKESCDHFITKRNMYNIAYELQKFMKDHVNAAKTCILFYQNQKPTDPLLTYSTLYSRLHYLEEARSHLTQAMDIKPSRQSKLETKPLADLNAYLENIKLQIDVTKLLNCCVNKDLFITCVKVGKTPLTQTPTLFGTPALKTTLAAEIITAPKNVNLGIELVVQIIKVFRLEACDVFSEAAVSLLVAKRSEDLKQVMVWYGQRYKITEMERDQVIINAVKQAPGANMDSEVILGLLSCDISKVEVNIQLGRLRNAYLAAVKSNMVGEVKKIRQLAADKGDNSIREICERYLQQHDSKK